jgi:hypothetical protein
MRPITLGAVFLTGALGLLVGCQGPAPSNGAGGPGVTANNAIDTGLSFSDGAARDDMAVQIANEASAIGDTGSVQHALTRVVDAVKHDTCASACALTLARLSKPADASDVARTIGDSARRDYTLAGVAANGR